MRELGKHHQKWRKKHLGIALIAFAPLPPRTQTGTLGHFISEKSAPNHPGKGLDPPKIKQILPKKVAPNHPGNAQMPSALNLVGLP